MASLSTITLNGLGAGFVLWAPARSCWADACNPAPSAILPHLNYCVTAWGYQCNKIIKLQKKAIRTVMISSYNAHTESFFKNLKLLKIQDILTLQTLKIYHKFRSLINSHIIYKIGRCSKIQTFIITTRAEQMRHTKTDVVMNVFAQKSLKLNITNIVNGTPDIILDIIDIHSF